MTLIVKTATAKATETVLKEVLGFQDRQAQALQSIAERLSSVEDSVNVLLQGPHRTARTWLSEAATSSEDQKYKLRHAREYLYEAYSLATTPLTQAAIARETALLLTVLGSVDAHGWWRKAVTHALDAMDASASHARALVGRPPARREATASEIAEARRARRMIGGFRLGGLPDQERFWVLAGPHITDLQEGREIRDHVLASLPAARAIAGALEVAALFDETRSAAQAAGIPGEELPDVRLRVDLVHRPHGNRRNPLTGARDEPDVRIDVVPRRVLASGPELAEVLAGAFPEVLELSVARLLDAIPNIGAKRRKIVYRDSGLSARRRLSTLSPDELVALEEAIRSRTPRSERHDIRLLWHRHLDVPAV